MQKKGFTLIELLVVIAILAILSVVVILTINPAQMLRQARDSQRVSDMATLKSAISLYLVDQTSPIMGTSTWCYMSSATAATTTAGCGGRMSTSNTTNVTTSAANAASTTGGGWIPINFGAISSGSPVGSLPIDPVNNATYFYSYAVNSTTLQFEIDADMESTRYAASGTSDVESTDGGSSSSVYETGSNLGL